MKGKRPKVKGKGRKKKRSKRENSGHSLLPLLPLAIHVECGCGGTSSSAPPSASTCQALARKWHPIRVVVVILPPSSCPQMAIRRVFLLKNSLARLALMWFTLRLLMAREHLCRAEWTSGLRRQRQHREQIVSLDFEPSTHESLHSIQLSLVHGCAQCSGWRVSSSSVSTAHMSFNLVRYSVTVDSSSFAVSLFLGDSISFTSTLSARESIDQTCFAV